MTKFEHLNTLMENPQINEAVRTIGDPVELRCFLSDHGLEVTQEELNEFLVCFGEAIEEKLGNDEIDEGDLENVVGGAGLTITLGGLTIKMTAAAAAFGTGVAIGAGVALAVGIGYLAYRTYKKSR